LKIKKTSILPATQIEFVNDLFDFDKKRNIFTMD